MLLKTLAPGKPWRKSSFEVTSESVCLQVGHLLLGAKWGASSYLDGRYAIWVSRFHCGSVRDLCGCFLGTSACLWSPVGRPRTPRQMMRHLGMQTLAMYRLRLKLYARRLLLLAAAQRVPSHLHVACASQVDAVLTPREQEERAVRLM